MPSQVDDLRGTPMSVGNLEEIIDDKCDPSRLRLRLITSGSKAYLVLTE